MLITCWRRRRRQDSTRCTDANTEEVVVPNNDNQVSFLDFAFLLTHQTYTNKLPPFFLLTVCKIHSHVICHWTLLKKVEETAQTPNVCFWSGSEEETTSDWGHTFRKESFSVKNLLCVTGALTRRDCSVSSLGSNSRRLLVSIKWNWLSWVWCSLSERTFVHNLLYTLQIQCLDASIWSGKIILLNELKRTLKLS